MISFQVDSSFFYLMNKYIFIEQVPDHKIICLLKGNVLRN